MRPRVVLPFFVVNVYEVSIFLGFALAALYFYRRMVWVERLGKRQVGWALFFGFFVQYFGGSILSYLYRWIYFGVPPAPRDFGTAGRFFHSAFLSVLVYAVLISKRLKWPTWKVLDGTVVAAMIMSSVGRIGCFFQGCCSGRPTHLPWGVCFPRYPGAPVHPAQVYMFLAETALWIYLWRFDTKKKKYAGQTFWLGVLMYSIYRFFIEFLRTNPVFFLGLSHAQVFSALTFLPAAAALFFFRDPRREILRDRDAVLSAADGRVVASGPCEHPLTLKPGLRVAVYLSFFNVHVNRSPVSGVVRLIRHSPGRFFPAYDKKAYARNESNLIVIETADRGEVTVRQIAGRFARRIVCDCREGQRVNQGDRIGLIQFGSGVEVYLPAGAVPKVRPGEKVVGGRTALAVFPK